MRAFDYVAPATLDASVHTLREAASKQACLLAGGTDLLPLMKAHIAEPRLLVNLKRVADMPRAIEPGSDGLRIGALATLAEIEHHPDILRDWPALAQAAASAATPQLRNMATVGGTLMQRPRCWYFRNENFKCWLKGGAECTARAGENSLHALFETGPCRAVHPSDVACALSALDAQIEMRTAKGVRMVPLLEFFAPPTEQRRVETTLGPHEVVLAIRMPRPAPGTRSLYLKTMERAAWAFATVSVAASARVVNGVFDDVRVVLGGVAAVPWLLTGALAPLQGARPGADAFAAAAREALAPAEPLRMNAYKVPLAQALIRRALHMLSADAPSTAS